MTIITGTHASEILNGTKAPDTIEGLGGGDQIDALGGDDTISGGDGADTLRGGDGNDVIYGHSVADLDPNSGNINATLLANVGAGALFVTGAPGDDGFVYALRKDTGDIARINTNTGAQSTFLDIPDSQFSTQSERGVLGLAFHPDYAANGRFFVYLTNPTGDIEVREYARSAGDSAIADVAPVQTIITIPHSAFANHNGGSLTFGPDGNLYIAVGDGGSANDPDGNAQNINVLLGKILRIDVNGDDFPGDPSRNYAIPDDNPFAGVTPGADEIWDYGLRNPWRISFDPLTGDLYIGDVGQSAREEVDFEPSGGPGGVNYGWDFREGTLQGPSAPPVPPISFTGPVFDYPRDVGHSITGGYVYRGPAPGLQGAYFFGDFISGRLMTLRMVNGVAEDAIDRTAQLVGADLSLISSFGTDNAGNLYVVTFGGAIYRLDPGIAAGDSADAIDGGAGNDSLFGGQGDDTLLGGLGNDILTGGVGADDLRGGADNDTYVIDNAGDIVNESVAGSTGSDTVQSSISFSLANASRVLGAVENLTLLGSGNIDGIGNALGNGITGNAGRNLLTGGAGNDVIQGLGGDDQLDGGTGNDVLKGGAGNDTYVIATAGDTIDEGGNLDSADAVRSTISVDLNIVGAGALEHATLLGTGAINAMGNAAGNSLTGNKAANLLDGRGGADIMTGGDGADTYVIDHLGDKAIETNAAAAGGIDLVRSSVSFTLGANLDKLTLTGKGDIDGKGNGLNNVILGNDGDNRLDGAAGKDAMTGGKGDDTYVVDTVGDAVKETIAAGGGIDTVESSITLTLAALANIEKLTLTGSAANGTGNTLGNLITGNALANILDGRAGADTLRGGAGNDLYILDNAGDLVEELGTDTGDEVKSASVRFAPIAGIENYTYTGAAAWTFAGTAADNRISGGGGADNLNGTDGNDTIFGNAGNDILAGGIGDDLLDGGTGSDIMKGGVGNDIYVVNAAGDTIDEEGKSDSADLVRSSISINLATLAAGLIENATLLGTAAINATGNLAANHLIGNGGANTLDGAGDADILEGGKGSDSYKVDNLGDQVIENIAGSAGGTDLVKSFVSFTLGANLEKLTLQGSDNIDATGNSLNNVLIGNGGANVLDGGAGSDTMTGGKGDDIYVVNIAGDVVNESAGGGSDTVRSAVTFSLATRVNIEDLVLAGAAKINGTGNGLANHINGNDADNIISGGGGNDTIAGGAGADRLTGGTGRDTFDFNLLTDAGDTITDFARGAAGDVLDLRDILEDAGYLGSTPFADGILSFVPSGSDTRISIDADGAGGSSATTVATLLNVSLVATDTANFLT
ncbi:MAG TPA: PQQ-dependent sugar dehydrogenase [Dongiaceae bacterium]|nr:PQQ-dependent sugar dehydrogenase [Dongiaceae bacterium]